MVGSDFGKQVSSYLIMISLKMCMISAKLFHFLLFDFFCRILEKIGHFQSTLLVMFGKQEFLIYSQPCSFHGSKISLLVYYPMLVFHLKTFFSMRVNAPIFISIMYAALSTLRTRFVILFTVWYYIVFFYKQ